MFPETLLQISNTASLETGRRKVSLEVRNSTIRVIPSLAVSLRVTIPRFHCLLGWASSQMMTKSIDFDGLVYKPFCVSVSILGPPQMAFELLVVPNRK
ncbi:hypothetical protein EVAR_69756_1 [Eumeta japonica]|uniref:Uncharacterized protein n=1 Tax=Eumeta variegata TaxID=151549 RepID=A0A4C1T3C5_EUMVA|nr:hypothetical protein EVAR_69756_1 [Eumeta japonica]